MKPDSPLQLRAIYEKLDWLLQKQKVHTDNLSRSNVPKEATKEIQNFDFGALLKAPAPGLTKSHPAHLDGHQTDTRYRVRKSADQPEVSLADNSINPEEQLMELNEAVSQSHLMQKTHQDLVGRFKQIYTLTGK